MNKINQQLEKIKQENRLGIMTHVVIGSPTLQESVQLVEAMAEVGVDFVELQIPFSDPLADGPTIMQANQTALQQGVKTQDAFTAMAELSKKLSIPLLFMTYYNIVLNYGVEKFCVDANTAGASGLIVPDMPIEEEKHEHYLKYAKQANLIPIRLLSPVSTEKRIKLNAKNIDGFLYFAGRKGTTGAKAKLDKELTNHLQRLQKHITCPIAVGFGISQPEHITALKQAGANIAVIGSAVLNEYNQAESDQAVERVKKYLHTFVQAAKS